MSEHSLTHEPKRGNGAAPPTYTLRFGDCELDFARHELRRAGALVALQPTPLRVLLHLAEQRGRTVSRHELFEAVWPGVIVGDDALTRALMEARRAVGDDTDAQRVIRTLKGLGYRFVAEVDVVGDGAEAAAPNNGGAAHAPAEKTTALALAAGIAAALALGGLAAWWWAKPEPPAPVPFGVLVLPVANIAGDGESRALADGLTEQLTHAISANGYPVVARTTAAQWKDRAADVRAFGREFGVSHVLEGGVQRDQGRARVTMQLVSTHSGLNVWSEVFEHTGGERFAFQDRVTTRVGVRVYHLLWTDIAALEGDPNLAEIARLALASRRTLLDDRNPEFLGLNDRLLAITPNRAPFLELRASAHARASTAWANLYAYAPGGTRSFAVAAPNFLRHAQAAVAAAPGSPMAHSELARAHSLSWQWAEAEREVERTCELAPHGWECGRIVQHVCAALGCVDRTLEVVDAWRRAQPAEYGASWNVAWVMVNAARFEEAETASLRARELEEAAAWFLPLAQWRLGKRDEAITSLRRWVARSAGAEATARELERVHIEQGSRAAMLWVAEQQAAGNAYFCVSPNQNDFQSALSFALLGDFELSLRALERSVAEHEPGMELYGLDPVFDPIRDTPRFCALLDRMGLTPYHEKYGVFERARQRVAAAGPNNQAAP